MDLLNMLMSRPASRVYGAFNDRGAGQSDDQDPEWLEDLDPEDLKSVEEVQRGDRSQALLRIGDSWLLVEHHPGIRDKEGAAANDRPEVGKSQGKSRAYWGYRVRVWTPPKKPRSRMPHQFIAGSLIGVMVTAWAAVQLTSSPQASPPEVVVAKPDLTSQPAVAEQKLNPPATISGQTDPRSPEEGNERDLAAQVDESAIAAASTSTRQNLTIDQVPDATTDHTGYHRVVRGESASGWCAQGYIPWRNTQIHLEPVSVYSSNQGKLRMGEKLYLQSIKSYRGPPREAIDWCRNQYRPTAYALPGFAHGKS